MPISSIGDKYELSEGGNWSRIVWLVINWILDLVVLVPMAKMAIGIYFAHIGLRYLMIPTMSISMGYLLQNKERRER